MKKTAQHLIAEVPCRRSRVETTIGIDLGDVWSHYCTINQDGEVVDRGRFRTSPKAVEKWFTDLPPGRVAMEAGTHSIWISEQLQELGHEVIVANVRELRAISHSDRKSDQVDAEKLARYARLDPQILRPIAHRTVEQQEALTLIRARDLLVRLRTAAVNAVRGLTKSCGYRMPASSTRCFAKRSLAVMPPGLAQAAVRRLAYDAADSGLLSPELAADIHRVKGVRKLGSRLGNWLTAGEAAALWQVPDRQTLTGKRNRAILAILLGCGLRRRELAELTLESLQRREERWAIVDLNGKARHIRTVPVPNWVKETLDAWLTSAGIESGPLFRCVCRAGKPWGHCISEKTVWHVVKKTAASMNIPRLAPHDLRRSCARLCNDSGGELEQIQFLLGHVSLQTTERYIASSV